MKRRKTSRMIRIGAFFNRQSKASREQVIGIFNFAAQHPDWELHLFTRPSSAANLRRLVGDFVPDGIIAGHPNIVRAFRKQLRRRIPAVVVDYHPRGPLPPDCALVFEDARAAGALGARNFLDRGFAHFAFAGLSPDGADGDSDALDSIDEEAGFVAELGKAGHTAAVYRERLPPAAWHFEDRESLARWLKGLPKPTALLVHSDTLALSVYAACHKIGLRIPDQLAIVAIGNEDSICESANPTLSSIDPDFRQAGLRAANLLDARLRDKVPLPGREIYGIRTFVDRLSSRKVTGARHLAMRAHETIRQRALSGLRVSDLTADAGVSQRTLEHAYADIYGMTLREDLLRFRLDEAERLLQETSLPIGAIYARCGFRTATALKAAFARRHDCSMRDFRKQRT